MTIAPDLFLSVEVGSITIEEAAEQAIALRNHLGVSLNLHFDAGEVIVTPSMSASNIVEDYMEILRKPASVD